MPPRSRWVWELGCGRRGKAGEYIPEWTYPGSGQAQEVSTELKLEASMPRSDKPCLLQALGGLQQERWADIM